MAGAQPGFDTTIAAQADPLQIASFKSLPSDIDESNPAIKLSPAPFGFIGAAGKIPV